MKSSCCSCRFNPVVPAATIGGRLPLSVHRYWNSSRKVIRVMASVVDSTESSADFAKRIDKAWLISQQPRPVSCSSCDSHGHLECKWCNGTGFFILGDNMLCQVPSRNTTCVICAGTGSMCCRACKGTGFRAKWI